MQMIGRNGLNSTEESKHGLNTAARNEPSRAMVDIVDIVDIKLCYQNHDSRRSSGGWPVTSLN